MRQSTFLLGALAGITFAQNQTIEIFFPASDDVDLVASVVTANPSTTTLAAGCPSKEDASDCGFGPGVTFAIISKTKFEATMSESDALSYSVSCEHNTQKSEMVCVESVGGSEANFPGVSTSTFSGTELTGITVTVTAGAEKLAAATGASAAESTVERTASAKSGMSTAAATSRPTASGASAAGASATGSPPQATGAGYRVDAGPAIAIGAAGVALLNFL